MVAEFELDGRRYSWTGYRWLDQDRREPPSRDIVRRLGALLRRANRSAEASLTDASAVLAIAINARVNGQPARAERFARRALDLDPTNATAGAILSSVWREKGRAKAALELTNRFQDSNDPYVLTSRAAALCDVGRWEEALIQIEQVLAIETRLSGGGSDESRAVLGRIRSQAPHLDRNQPPTETDVS
jgi:tetratricopeptide (TPR) repeat protein